MSTSLKQQLERLAVPATSALADARTKASILFDRKEAGTKDRRTIYELGLSGLQELIASCPAFQQFTDTLFNEESLQLERAVENKEMNDILNANIKKFFIYLQPYLMVRPAHLCIEWLLRRFHVHMYNKSELMALIMPYHETNIFVRVLQTMKLRVDVHWSWLRPLQKPGVPLPKSTLFNRAASNADFLRFVCASTEAAVAELSAKYPKLLQAQLNFYASVVVGALEVADIKEWHITTVLPSMLHGILSPVEDYVAAAYIVAAQLVARTKLTAKICNVLLKRVPTMPFKRLRPSAVLLMICILEKQKDSMPKFTKKTLHELVQKPWLLVLIGKCIKDNISVHALCTAMLRTAVDAIHKNEPEAEVFKKFLNDLVATLSESESTLEHFISAFLESYTNNNDEEEEDRQKIVQQVKENHDNDEKMYVDEDAALEDVAEDDDELVSMDDEHEKKREEDEDDDVKKEDADEDNKEQQQAKDEQIENEVIVLDSEDDDKRQVNNSRSVQSGGNDDPSGSGDFDLSDEYDAWYSQFLKHLEDVCPTSFDRVVKEAAQLNVNASSKRNKALKFATGEIYYKTLYNINIFLYICHVLLLIENHTISENILA